MKARRHLGAAIGTPGFRAKFVEKKVQSWLSAIKKLCEIAKSQPHAAFAVFTHCLQSQWTFVSRSTPEIGPLLQPLEDEIRLSFLPSLLRRNMNDEERLLLSLPARLGGMGILNPVAEAVTAHSNSIRMCDPLIRLILRQETDFDPFEIESTVKSLRKQIEKQSDEIHMLRLKEILVHASEETKQCVKLFSEKGASSWLTCIPSYETGTILHKGDFVDSVHLRYGWQLKDLPSTCACGVYMRSTVLSVDFGQFNTMRCET